MLIRSNSASKIKQISYMDAQFGYKYVDYFFGTKYKTS